MKLDWTDTGKKYGYFDVYTDSVHCEQFIKADKIDFGVGFKTPFSGTVNEDQDFRIYIETGSI